MKGFFVFVLFFAFTCLAHGQVTQPISGLGKISGHVIDSANTSAIDYATIALTHMGETKVVNGATTDENGKFTLEHVAEGTYKITINFLGYNKFTKENIVVSTKNSVINLGKIILSESKALIADAVTVTAQKSIIENKIDKLVFNVERDLTSQGGAALDILKKIPMVSVDVDGNVDLQGNSNVRFLIDGKPSTMYGNSLTDVLKSIPSNQIESIEVVTSPGAKYDAEGSGGIINIILKKSTIRGINGNVNLSGGTRLENGSFNLNWRHDNFGARVYMSGNAQLLSNTITNLNRTSLDISKQGSVLTQNGSSGFTRSGYDAGSGFDWTINPHNSITGVGGISYQTNHTQGNTNQNLKTDSNGTELLNQSSLRYADNQYINHSIYWSLNYKKTFDTKGQELTVAYNGNYGQSAFHQTNEVSGTGAGGLIGNNPVINRETSVQTDYTHPFSEKFILETGAKAYLRSIGSISDVYTSATGSDFVYNPSQSFSFNYNRNIYSAYVSATFSLFNFLDGKAGGRFELTHTDVNYSNASNVNVPDYYTFAPSLTLAHNFKDGQSLKISYSHRIERPDYRVLNPFINITDPKNITTGDPTLQPELSDKLEFGYNKSFDKGGNINIVLFYRTSNHDIQQYVVYYPTYKVGDSTFTNVSVGKWTNVGLEENEGINIFGSVPVTSKLNIRGNLAFFNRYIISAQPGAPNIRSFNYRVNINASYQFTKELVAEFFGNFNSARNELQGRYPSFTTYNFAVRKSFWKDKASIALVGTNVFNEYVDQETQISGIGFTQNSLRRLPYRSFGISLAYKFGKLEFKNKKEEEEKPENPDPNP